MKLRILLIMLISFSLMAMEQPPRAGKRPAAKSAEELQGEPKTHRIEPGAAQPQVVAGLEFQPTMGGIPQDLRDQIFNYLIAAQGGTGQIKLINAAQNIRNYLIGLSGNKQFKQLLYNTELAGQIIMELAKRYTNNNVVVAAQALATDAASKWLAEYTKQNYRQIVSNLSEALFSAIDQGDLGSIRFLLYYQPVLVSSTIFSQHGQTLLEAAVSKSNKDIVALLFKFGANFNGYPIHAVHQMMERAAERDLDILKILVAAGGNINQMTARGSNLLSFAGNADIAKYLIQNGLSVNHRNTYGVTALYFAVLDGKDDVVKVLLNAGADLNIIDNEGKAPIHLAVEKDNANILYDLLNKGANIELADGNGNTPLMLAVKDYKLKAAQTLLEKGADVVKYLKDDGTGLSWPLFRYVLSIPYPARMANADPYALAKIFINVQQLNVNPTLPRVDINARVVDDNTKTFLGYVKTFPELQKQGLDGFIQFLITEQGAKE